jgi:hypothetical protein
MKLQFEEQPEREVKFLPGRSIQDIRSYTRQSNKGKRMLKTRHREISLAVRHGKGVADERNARRDPRWRQLISNPSGRLRNFAYSLVATGRQEVR